MEKPNTPESNEKLIFDRAKTLAKKLSLPLVAALAIMVSYTSEAKAENTSGEQGMTTLQDGAEYLAQVRKIAQALNGRELTDDELEEYKAQVIQKISSASGDQDILIAAIKDGK